SGLEAPRGRMRDEGTDAEHAQGVEHQIVGRETRTAFGSPRAAAAGREPADTTRRIDEDREELDGPARLIHAPRQRRAGGSARRSCAFLDGSGLNARAPTDTAPHDISH